MDGTIKFNLKSDAVPTMFSHAKPVKRRISSSEQDTSCTKKVHLINVLSEQTLSEQAGDTAAILFSGNTFQRIKEMMNIIMNIVGNLRRYLILLL